MAAFLGLAQFILMIINCVYELRRKSVSVFLWAVLAVMFGIPHTLATLFGAYKYSSSTMNEASVFVILFCLIYLLMRYILTLNKVKNNNDKVTLSEEETNTMNKFMKILFFILMIVVLARSIMIIRQGGGLLNTSWETMRAVSTSGYLSFSQIFITLFFVSSSCIILAIRLKNKKILFGGVLLILIEVIISRNRIEILPIFVAIIYSYIYSHDKLKLKSIIFLGIIGIVAIYIIYALRAFRHIGTFDNLIRNYDIKSFNDKVVTYFENDDGELSLREYMYYFIENNNYFTDFGKGHTYKRMMLIFVPTKWSFDLKPTDFAITMGKAVLPNSIGYSIHPTLFGDVYANFGTYGFAWGAFWAIFVSSVDKIIERRNKIIYLPFALNFGIAYIIEARGSVYNAFAWSVYGAIILAVLYTIFKWVNNSEKIFKKNNN